MAILNVGVIGVFLWLPFAFGMVDRSSDIWIPQIQ
jgi:hypothetical protein